jgi:hypothetical protein
MDQNQNLFRKKSIERISSPEQLNDYLRVTSPSTWIILIAVIVLRTGIGNGRKNVEAMLEALENERTTNDSEPS